MTTNICPICNSQIINDDSFNFKSSCTNNDYVLFHTSKYDMEIIKIDNFKLNSVINDYSKLSIKIMPGDDSRCRIIATLPYIKPSNKETMLHKFNTIKNFL